MTVIEKLAWLNNVMGVSFKTLAKYCDCTSATLGRYANGTLPPTEKTTRLIERGLETYMIELNKKMGE